MKLCLRSFLLFLLLLPAAVRADTGSPMFAGNALTIGGDTYTWTNPATETATQHTDTYTNTTGQTVTVTGMISNPNLATVSGSSSTGTVAGYLQNGSYGDNHQTSSSSGSWQIGGVTYLSLAQDMTYQVDFTQNMLITNQAVSDYTIPGGAQHLHRVSTWSGNYTYMNTHDTFTGGCTPFSGLNSVQAFGSTYAYSSSHSDSNKL